MPSETLLEAELSEAQFIKISQLVKTTCGINLGDGKQQLVKARLMKRLRKLGLWTFEDYLQYVRNDATGTELTAMFDALSTNMTSFFREEQHFKHLSKVVFPHIIAKAERSQLRQFRIWSAGCSSGEEPYSLAITVHENIPDLQRWDVKILASDISTRMLKRASDGFYNDERVKTVSPQLRARYFRSVQTRPERIYEVTDALRSMIHFARVNLMGPWPMRGPFDVIFCRNVMIYFDKPTQGKLVQRYWDMLAPGGKLFLGHSESLTGIEHKFGYVQPTVYQKP